MDPDSSSMGDDIPTPESYGDSAPEWESVLSTTDARASKEAIPESPFEMKGCRALLDAIDELQSCGVSQELEIPQIVVVGCQSSGKSSLLQNLTGIPFPVGKDCCTRFATRIVSRQTAPGTANTVKIAITRPDVANVFDYPPDGSWRSYKYEDDHLETKEFERIIEEVSAKYMKIKRGTGPDKKNFASQVLRIEISGPTRSHFSILDVPGVTSVPRRLQDNEMRGVQRILKEYMNRISNIVLCVADAGTDLSNQTVLTTASALVDKTRLVGVFTKCDRVADPSEIVEIATGDEVYPKNSMVDGWFVVRNRDEMDGDGFDLLEAERDLFSQPPWRKIREERRGSDMLRRHLGDLLFRRIEQSFTGIQATIRGSLRDARRSRESLGEPRPTHALRLEYIREVVEEYASDAGKALTGPGAELLDCEQVRAKVHKANVSFTEKMMKEGHTFEFEEAGVDLAETFTKTLQLCYTRTAPLSQLSGGMMSLCNPTAPPTPPKTTKPKKMTAKRTTTSQSKNNFLIRRIRRDLPDWQFTELPGVVTTEFIQDLFRRQSEEWQEIGEDHINDVAAHIEVVYKTLLKEACGSCDDGDCHPSDIIHAGLAAVLGRFQIKAKGRAISELRDYCRRERDSKLQTTDPKFSQMLQKWRSIRLLRAYAKIPDYEEQDDMDPVAHAEAVFKAIHHSVEDNMVYDIHDTVRVYYELALEAFIRYVTSHIMEHMVTCEDGPLKALSTGWVFNLTEEEVERLGREDEDTIHKRAHFDSLIDKYERAGSIAARARKQSLKSMD